MWATATRTAADFRSDHFYTPFILPVLRGTSWYGKKAQWPASYLDAAPDQPIPIFPEGSVKIVVTGGATNPFTQAWQLGRPSSVRALKWA